VQRNEMKAHAQEKVGCGNIKFYSPVDYKTLPVDFLNFIAQTAAMPYYLFLW